MSVYIKDMEIPCEEAEPLRIELYADGTVIVIKEQDDFYEFKAVPVPPHGGDLIDRETAKLYHSYLVDEKTDIRIPAIPLSVLNVVPAIIKGE